MNFSQILPESCSLPAPADKLQLKNQLKSLDDEIKKSANPEVKKFFNSFLKSKEGKELLNAILGNSLYLTQCILKELEFFKFVVENGYEESFHTLSEELLQKTENNNNKDAVMTSLRAAKIKCSLLVAMADITNYWNLEEVTSHLSKFAEQALNIAVNFLLRKGAVLGQLEIKDAENPSKNSGLVVLSLGKLGSEELNYSSDIDIIFFFDEKKVKYTGKSTISHFFTQFVQEVAHMMQERTRDGYVFRTDLRLRPDSGSTPPAISISAAKLYYESLGQNWERAAMIKARPIAGDMKAGKDFIKFLSAFVWRKYLDFTSVQDIHSIKRQIDSRQGKLPKNLYGYNVKLGHGGIREIEFYAQTQQLIWGGREPSLRISATCKALDELYEIDKISAKARDELKEAYCFYRTVEHRLQMVLDQQTHTFPESSEGIEKIAIFMGFENADEFIKKHLRYLKRVRGHYARLFENSPSLASDLPGIRGSLVFTGVENDPETLSTLEKMGFKAVADISETVRGWHHGRRRATRTKRARELLTELMPTLLLALSKTPSPNVAFSKFDEFLAGLPSGVQIFSLFYANPHLLNLVALIMGGYPHLANNLSRKPELIEYVLSPEFYDELPELKKLEKRLNEALKEAESFEDVLNITRSWTHDRQFRVGIQLIKDKISAEEASLNLSNIANVVLSAILTHVKKDFVTKYGEAGADSFAILAMGKLGGNELTFLSDLDLVFIYDTDAFAKEDANMFSASEYFIRLSRRFITALTSLTNEGRLYEIDTRLRPSGKDGPVACSLEAFENYYEKDAWDWEYMALTRAKVVYGSPSLAKKINRIIRKKLENEWDNELLAKRIMSLRDRIGKQHKTSNPFHVKYIKGGLLDLEFISQYMQLTLAKKNPKILDPNTKEVLYNLHSGKFLNNRDANTLIQAATLYHSTQCMLRLTDNKDPKEKEMTEGMKKALAKAIAQKDFKELKKRLVESQKKVQNLLGKIISA